MYGNLSVSKPFTGDWTTMTNWPSNPPTRNTSVSSAASGIELDSSFRVPYGSTPRSTNGNWDDATDLQSQKGSIKETHLHTARVLDRQATVTQATPFTTSRIDERSGTPTSGQFSPDAPRFVPVPSPTRQTFTVTVSHPDTATSHHSLQIPSTVNDVVPLSSRGNSVEDEYPNNQTLSIPQATAHIPLLPRSYGYVPPPPDYNSYHAPDFHYTYQPSDPSYSSPSPPTINSPTPPLLYVSHGIPTPQMNSNVVPVSEMYRQQMYYYENPQLTAQYFLPVSYPQQAAPLPPAHSTMIAPQGPLSLLEKKREHQYGANVHQAGPNYPLNPIRSSPSHRQRYPDQSPFFIPSGPMPTPQVFSGGRNSMRGGHRWHPPHGADATTPSVTVRSPTLEAFRANKTRKWELKDIFGHAVEFSGDQHGSRFIQQKLENATSEDKQTIFDEIVPVNAIQLMKDVFGNYVIQKFFEYGTLSQKSKLAQVMEGRIHILSLQMYGCRVVQKAIEFVLPEEQAIFVKELEPHILECVKDSNGNHVIQKLVECVPPESLGFVKIFKGNIHALATHPYGCRVLQRCLEHFPEETTRPLTEELHVFSPTLMEDQYGNYVMQYILEHGRPNDKTLIVSKLQGRLLVLARHKYASNVCEKALLCTDTETRRRLVEEILTTRPDGVTPITGMMKDQYANYVLQRAMIVAVGDQKETLFNKVIPQVQSMRKHSSVYAKHLTAIERLIEKHAPTAKS